jgi:hypothetical protein
MACASIAATRPKNAIARRRFYLRRLPMRALPRLALGKTLPIALVFYIMACNK